MPDFCSPTGCAPPSGRISRAPAAAVLLLALALASAAPAPAVARTGGEPLPAVEEVRRVPGALLVTMRRGHGLRGLTTLPGVRELEALGPRTALTRVEPGSERQAIARLQRDPRVLAVEWDRLRQLASAPNDAQYPGQWAHKVTHAQAAWDALRGRTGAVGSREVRVAVIDSGIQATHPDLRANVIEQVDVSVDPPVAVGPGVDNDGCGLGHGTFVAGIIGATGDNRLDVAGVAWEIGIIDVAVSSPRNPESCDRLAGVPDSAILRGIQHAVGRGAHVINLSLAAFQSSCPIAYQEQMAAAREAGALVVAAAGNGQQRASTRGLAVVPASCDGVVSVGATVADGAVAAYSSANRWVDLVAPGGDAGRASGCVGARDCIVSTVREGGTDVDAGTSFAAAYVSGSAALLRSARPDASPEDVEALLERTSTDLDPPGRDPAAGWGALRLDRAMRAALAPDPIPPPEPDPAFPVSDGRSVAPAPQDPAVTRIAVDGGATEPVAQAVAVSRAVFGSGAAAHVLLTSPASYADALAGSALGFGAGPLLFTDGEAEVESEVRAELLRVLPTRGRVYLLGGRTAVRPAVENDLRMRGYDVVRLAGPGREETAAAVARETAARLRGLGVTPPRSVILVTRNDWADAVTAGGLAAYFGVPVLLTPSDRLHPATEEVLAELRPAEIYVVGGERVVSAPTAEAAAAAAQAERVTRLAGLTRDATAVEVAREVEAIFARAGMQPRFAIAVNVSRPDAFTHALAASGIVGAFSGVFVPVLGEDGDLLSGVVEDYVRGLGIDGIVVGGTDAISERAQDRLEALLEGRPAG